MNRFVRGGALLTIISFCVVIIISQTRSNTLYLAASTSQQSVSDTSLTNSYTAPAAEADLSNIAVSPAPASTPDDDTKLVKKTALVTARGASRGAFSASAYCFTGRTATGGSVHRGVIAADPRVLRLGSKVIIEAGAWTGEYTVADTGGAIKGKKIDIWVPNCSEARKFGRRTVQIFAVE